MQSVTWQKVWVGSFLLSKLERAAYSGPVWIYFPITSPPSSHHAQRNKNLLFQLLLASSPSPARIRKASLLIASAWRPAALPHAEQVSSSPVPAVLPSEAPESSKCPSSPVVCSTCWFIAVLHPHFSLPACPKVPFPALWVSWVPCDTTVKAGC